MDLRHWKQIASPLERTKARSEVVHIIPFSNGKFAADKCFPSLRVTMGVGKVNDTSNGLSLYGPLHREIGDFRVTFESMLRLVSAEHPSQRLNL
ncbi:hypothetical protein AJ78_07022 [Emergomyces pasteurianus Ep9510]|uniref:HNH nuclease domain-containing protein n=1 Tax=Emergomyces pasteurianus Ep9510 TaxID=1447872 RepID=A0A1J9P8W2_9EURO|nr:hypothetical protein AJ78_07022 [Emergomyces pasteurianus Ep9510]